MTIKEHAEETIALYREARRHAHMWKRDDRDGYREYVCVVCAYSFGIPLEPVSCGG